MGLPLFMLEFKTKAETAVSRGSRGVVAVILADDTKTTTDCISYTYTDMTDVVKSHWTTANYAYLEMIFKGSPKSVIVERIGTSDDYTAALARLKNKKWNWLTVPGLADAEGTSQILEWIAEQRENKKTFKAVLPCSVMGLTPNSRFIVDFAADEIKVGTKTYTCAEYCARIAGVLAGIALNKSATYYVLNEIDSIKESETPDADINAGRLIILNDGEKFKIARAVTSLTTLGENEKEEMKKIKIVEAMDFIFDDIRDVFESSYIGMANSYDNKQLFVSEVNDYFKKLENQSVLEPDGGSYAEIDLAEQRAWLKTQGKDVENMTDEQIKKAKTGSCIFLTGDLSFLDAIEDLKFTLYM